ncbi:MAG: hypothetical protein IPQ25_17510 [Chitinophagaceae bacterium]|nr:hypothetical protein [Chitinophagaceae bacterium]
MFNNGVQLTDVYKNRAGDLLLAVAIHSYHTGYTTQLQNIGATSNRGVNRNSIEVPHTSSEERL